MKEEKDQCRAQDVPEGASGLVNGRRSLLRGPPQSLEERLAAVIERQTDIMEALAQISAQQSEMLSILLEDEVEDDESVTASRPGRVVTKL